MNKPADETTSSVEQSSSTAEQSVADHQPSGRRRAVIWGGGFVVAIGLLVWAVALLMRAEQAGSQAVKPESTRPAALLPIDPATLKTASVEPLNKPAITDLSTQLEQSLGEIGSALDSTSFAAMPVAEKVTASSPDEIPRYQRWQIVFAAGLTEGQYARQLGALGMELGVLGDDGQIEYVADLGTAKPKRRKAPLANQRQIYFTWDRGDLTQADRILLANLGLKVADRIVLHCCSDEMVKKLAALEHGFQGKPVVDILRTRFSVKQTFRGYEVYVLDQQLRDTSTRKVNGDLSDKAAQ